MAALVAILVPIRIARIFVYIPDNQVGISRDAGEGRDSRQRHAASHMAEKNLKARTRGKIEKILPAALMQNSERSQAFS